MNILMVVLAPILWIGFAILEGIREGYFYNYRDTKDLEYSKDLHPLYTMQRSVMAIGLCLGLAIIGGWWSLLALASFGLVFPLFHDGFYYVTRNNIDSKIYPDRFKTDKNTTTAKISVQRFAWRLVAAIGGVIAYGAFCFFG